MRVNDFLRFCRTFRWPAAAILFPKFTSGLPRRLAVSTQRLWRVTFRGEVYVSVSVGVTFYCLRGKDGSFYWCVWWSILMIDLVFLAVSPCLFTWLQNKVRMSGLLCWKDTSGLVHDWFKSWSRIVRRHGSGSCVSCWSGSFMSPSRFRPPDDVTTGSLQSRKTDLPISLFRAYYW